MTCPNFSGCPMFPLFSLKATLKTWQIRYCEGDHSQCQRYQLGKQGRPVPNTLLPNGKLLPTRADGR